MKIIKSNIFWLLLAALTLRIGLSSFGTLRLDQGTFVAWSMGLASDGFRSFYNGWSDYLPGYLYILWLLGKAPAFIPDTLLYKIPAIISDLVTGYLIYKILSGKKGIIGAAIYLFNPAVFANSAMWGQVDSLTALFSVLSIYLLPINIYFSSISLAIGTLIKPQAAFIAPVIFILLIRNKYSSVKIFSYLILGLGIFVIGFLPFQNGPNFFNFIIERLTVSANQYPHTAVNAFNFWGLFGQWKDDNLYFQLGGYVLFVITFLLFVWKTWKYKNPNYLLTTFAFLFSFMFFTRMHERHLLPAIAPLTILAAGEFLYLIPLIGLSIVYVLNLYYSYQWVTYDFKVSFEPFPVIILGILSFVIFIFATFKTQKVKIFLTSLIKFFEKGRKKIPETFPKLEMTPKLGKIILILILLFSFATRLYKLNVPEKDYFDEIYHAFTARIILHNDPKAWEWWNPHPEGFAYEWTHPPLSKLMMVGGMLVFGENSFGWRVPQAIFGALSVFVLYLLTKKIFKDEVLALIAAAAFSLDGLGLVLSRMGMNDIYVLFFMLLSIYLFLREKDFLSALSFGLAISSKWSGIWTAPILLLLWLRRKDRIRIPTFLSFLIIPFAIYLLTYTQMFTTGHDLGTWWGMQQQMWWYHTGLDATHPYTSPWWSWPLIGRPVYLYTSDEIGGFVSRIYAMGNPVIFWFGLASVFTSFVYSYYQKNKNLALITFSYLVFFVPWAASPRIMFLYHYLPSIPFMCISIAYILRRSPKIIFPFFAFALLIFIYFYPHWAGLQIPLWLDKSYYWIGSWR
jgi:predicted membrane-bound dolichyl-phosphate-mannose-protein mannosyltransferase